MLWTYESNVNALYKTDVTRRTRAYHQRFLFEQFSLITNHQGNRVRRGCLDNYNNAKTIFQDESLFTHRHPLTTCDVTFKRPPLQAFFGYRVHVHISLINTYRLHLLSDKRLKSLILYHDKWTYYTIKRLRDCIKSTRYGVDPQSSRFEGLSVSFAFSKNDARTAAAIYIHDLCIPKLLLAVYLALILWCRLLEWKPTSFQTGQRSKDINIR